MYIVQLDWDNFKSEVISKGFIINFKVISNGYEVFALDRSMVWMSNISDTSEISDFETNFKVNCNKCVYDTDGKAFSRSEPRPLNCTTVFTNVGDTLSPPSIGTGTKLLWDASNSDEFTTTGAPDGFKQKTIDLTFLDTIYPRGGRVHTENAVHGAYLDMFIMCPPTGYYLVEGVLTQNNTGNYIACDHYVSALPLLMGTNSVELDSGTAAQGLPPYYLIRCVVTVPTTDTTSNGSAVLFIYRQRSIII